MSPRPYRMVARQAAAEETRVRIIAAAREMLATAGGIGAFTIDAVAARAGVARMTVYYQFGSKTGLIEGVFDSLAIVREGVQRLVAALALADPEETLDAFVRTFATVWEEDRLVVRRLEALAALDPEFSQVWHAREGRRREGMRQIAARVAARRPAGRGRRPPFDVESASAALFAIISPEGFEAMAGPDRTYEAIAPLVHQLARKALGLDGSEPVRLPTTRTSAARKSARARRPAG
jgi:AcrR family transcriptional regulator